MLVARLRLVEQTLTKTIGKQARAKIGGRMQFVRNQGSRIANLIGGGRPGRAISNERWSKARVPTAADREGTAQ